MNVKNLVRLYFSRMFTRPLVNETTLDIMTTYRCNLRCKMCNNWKAPLKDPDSTDTELSISDYDKLARDLKGVRCRVVELQGGEPFLRTDILDIISVFKKHGLGIRIVSNGTLITEELAKEIARSCLDITISLDGHNKRLHERNRGLEGCFEKTIHGIRLLELERKKSKSDLKIYTHTTYTDNNLSSPGPLLLLGKSLGVDGMRFTPASMGNEANFRGGLGEREGVTRG